MNAKRSERESQMPIKVKPHRRGASRLGTILALAIATCAFAASALTPSASAAVSFCGFGSAAGQCKELKGVATDPASGNVYVADYGNNRIDVFDSTGGFLFAFGWGVADGSTEAPQKCTTSCFKGISGPGLGQFDNPYRVAVDTDSTSASYRDLYVYDNNNFRVEKFDREGNFLLAFGGKGSANGQFSAANDPVAVGPGGTVYVSDSELISGGEYAPRIEKFDPSGAFIGSSALPSGGTFIEALVVNSAGDAYVVRNGVIQKYELSEPSATKLGETAAGSNTRSLAAGPSDRFFAMQQEPKGGGSFRVITEYDSTLAIVSRFGYEEIELNLLGLALSATGGGIFGSEEYAGSPSPGNIVRLIPLPPPGPLICCTEVAPGNTKATLKPGIDPEGKETTFHIDYVDQRGFEEQGGFEGPATAHTVESTSVGSDFTLHRDSTEIGCAHPEDPPQPSCLTPDTLYHYRIVATDSDPISNSSVGEFKTKPPVEVLETYATEVGTDAAQLHVLLSPLGIPTSGYFQYVDDATFQKDIEKLGPGHGFDHAAKSPDVGGGQNPIDFGSGEGAKAATAFLYPLAPATTYHYRIVVTDPLLTQPFGGPALTLATFPSLSEPTTSCPNQAFRGGASANLPDCRAYEMVSPVDKGGADIAVLPAAFGAPTRLEQSAADGERFSYSSSTAFGGAPGGPYSSQYLARRDPKAGWSTEPISPARESESLTDQAAVKFDTEFKAFSPDLASGWLLRSTDPPLDPCAPKGFLNLYRRDRSSGGYEALTTLAPTNQNSNLYWPKLQGLSVDGNHAVFLANAKLTANASSATVGVAPISQLYEHVSGKGCGTLRLVSVLPNGKANASSSSAGTQDNGGPVGGGGRSNRVARAVSADGSRIFWSVPALGDTGPGALYVRIGGKETIQIAAEKASYWTAAGDGSKAFYTTVKTIFEAKEYEAAELHEFDVDKKIDTLIAKGVVGVAEVSEDASRLYFVSIEALGGEGVAGRRNLYLRKGDGSTSLVATLGEADGDASTFEEGALALAAPSAANHGTRMTPDGEHLAFISSGELSGYDNTDAADGRADFELYLYDAPSGKLACISCNPSGARPMGRKFEQPNVVSTVIRVAAQLAPPETQVYAPRNLSTDGNRLFFESFEALLPRDTNGKSDVYEWQRAANAKACEEKGAELYVPSSGGCLSLISSGQSPTDTVFADATPDGSDAFIKTAASLLPQDPGLVDVYDAREGGGFPPAPSPPAPCEGEACQPTSSAPNDPTPASAAFKGAGNARATSCRKGKVRRKGRCIARKAKKRHAHKQAKRANHKRGGSR